MICTRPILCHIVGMEIELNDIDFDPVTIDGKTYYAVGDAVVDYTLLRDSWDYPLASAGTRYEDVAEIEGFDLYLVVTDEEGNDLFDDNEESVPAEIRKHFVKQFDLKVEEMVNENIE